MCFWNSHIQATGYDRQRTHWHAEAARQSGGGIPAAEYTEVVTEERYVRGQPDFPNIRDRGKECFNWNKEDKIKNPLNPRYSKFHFQDFATSAAQVRQAIENCDIDAMNSAMYRLQDFFSHWEKGYRWDPSNWQFGHLWDGKTPDQDDDAFIEAEKITIAALGLWNESCCLKNCGEPCEYIKRSEGSCQAE